MIYLAAAGAAKIALEKGLQHEDQRIGLLPAQLPSDDVSKDYRELAKGYGQYLLKAEGRLHPLSETGFNE